MAEYFISSTKFTIQERQTKKHGKVYDVVFRLVTLEGVEKQKKLSGYKTKTLAKEAYTEFVTKNCELIKNKSSIKRINEAKEIPTVDEMIKQYLLSLMNQDRESTIYSKQRVFNNFVLPYYKNYKITQITREEIYKWQDKIWSLKNSKTGKYYTYDYLSKVRTCFRSLLSWYSKRYNAQDPFINVEMPKRQTPKREMQFWCEDEFKKFISAVDEPMYVCLFTMLFYTGRRKGEICALPPEDVGKSEIRFAYNVTIETLDGTPYKITPTKTSKIGITPICPTLKKAMENYHPEANAKFYFGGNKPIPQETLRGHFNRYCKKAGVKQIRIHDLRHSFVSMLIHRGATIPVIADLIGDTQQQVMKTYSHFYSSDKENIMKTL